MADLEMQAGVRIQVKFDDGFYAGAVAKWDPHVLWTASMSLIEAISMLSIADIPSGDSDSDTDSSTDNENELKLSMRQVGVPHRDCHYRSTCMSMCSIES